MPTIKITITPPPETEKKTEKPVPERIKGGVFIPDETKTIVPNRNIAIRFYDLSTLMYGGVTDKPRQLDAALTIPPVGINTHFIVAEDFATYLSGPGDAGILQYLQWTAQGFYYKAPPILSHWIGNALYDTFFGDPWLGALGVPFFGPGLPVIAYTDEFYTSYLNAAEMQAKIPALLLDSVTVLNSGTVIGQDSLLLSADSDATNGVPHFPPYRFDSGRVTAFDKIQLISNGTPYREILSRWQLPKGQIDTYKLTVSIGSDSIPLTNMDMKRWKSDEPNVFINGYTKETVAGILASEILSRGGTQCRTGQVGVGGLSGDINKAVDMAMVQRPDCESFAPSYWSPGVLKFAKRGSLGSRLAINCQSIFFESFDTVTENFYATKNASPDAEQVKLSLSADVSVMLVPRWWQFQLDFDLIELNIDLTILFHEGHITISGFKRALTRPIMPQPFFSAYADWDLGSGPAADGITGGVNFTPSPGRRELSSSPFGAALRSYNYLPDTGFIDSRSVDTLCAWVESSISYLNARADLGPFPSTLNGHKGTLAVQTAPTVRGALVGVVKSGASVFYIWRNTDSAEAPISVASVPFNSCGDSRSTLLGFDPTNAIIIPAITQDNLDIEHITYPGIQRSAVDLSIVCQGAGSLVITTVALPNGTTGTSYSTTLNALGGSPPYTWSIDGGTLPTGLHLNASTGVISGTPTVAGSHSFTVHVIDTVGHTSQKILSITIVTGGGGGC